jgi:hypothetical protein
MLVSAGTAVQEPSPSFHGLKHGFDRKRETELVEGCLTQVARVFGRPNKFERRLAKRERIPVDRPATHALHMNVVFTDDPEYYCAGSGGVGGGKVFWTPYTSPDPETRRKAVHNNICDNCKTLTHEAQHGIGSNVEFDQFSDLVGWYNRIENFPPGEREEFYIRVAAEVAARSCRRRLKPWESGLRNSLCAVNERYPKQLREILLSEGLAQEQIDKTLKCACRGEKGG